MNRREFIAVSAAALMVPRATAANVPNILRAEDVAAQLLPTGDGLTGLWGFNGSAPGPELRVRQDEELALRFENGVDQGSAVHWHGIRLPNEMDGVPGLTQTLVDAGQGFDYRFRPPDAGTFWYHSHTRSLEQVARGLHGPLIVEEPDAPEIDQDITVVLDDWRLSDSGEQSRDFSSLHDLAHAGRLGNFARAQFDPELRVQNGGRVRLRFINAATDRVFPLMVNGIAGKVVALDGMPLDRPADIKELTLAPAQRMDIIADVTAGDGSAIEIVFPTREGPYDMGQIPVEGTSPRTGARPIMALPPNPVAKPDQANAIPVELLMEGGAMSARMMSGVGEDDLWAFNGASGLQAEPLHRFERGETGRITLTNDTRFAHGIHLHGHHFNEVGADGSIGPLRDTSLVQAGQARDIDCVFDNPGKWLLHCHMLGHQASGMTTWIEVA